jgi:hypothetical protein
MSVDEASDFFKEMPKIFRKVETMQSVGLGYITLGQSATTLSGGEAQRIKLSKELSKRDTGSTLYILDEPTTGIDVAAARQRGVRVAHTPAVLTDATADLAMAFLLASARRLPEGREQSDLGWGGWAARHGATLNDTSVTVHSSPRTGFRPR